MTYRNRNLPRRPAAGIALALVLACLSGCASFNPDNTPTLNLVRKHIVPESREMQVLAFPLVWPLGLAAGLLDTAVVHPVMVIDDAAYDTQRALWEDIDWDENYVTACVGLPWRAAFSPPAFAGSYFGRVLFDIPDRHAAERAAAKVRAAIETARQQIADGKPDEALRTLTAAELKPLGGQEAFEDVLADYEIAALEAAWQAERYPMMQPTWQTRRILESEKGDAMRALLERIREEGNPVARWQANVVEMTATKDEARRRAILTEALARPSAAYRLMAMQWMAANLPASQAMALRSNLMAIARQDADPTNRVFAQSLLTDLDARLARFIKSRAQGASDGKK